MAKNNVDSELNTERPIIDSNNCVVTCDNVKVYSCAIDENNNIKGLFINYIGNVNKAYYDYVENKWFYGKEIAKRNLINLADRTIEERKAICEKSFEKRRENNEKKKTFNELAKAMLEQTLSEKQISEILGTSTSMLLDDSVASVMLARMIQGAMEGSFKCAEFIRDTAGYRPKDVHEVQADIMTDADRRLIENVSKRIG